MAGESIGKVEWLDLTITNADEVRDFYRQVTGWGVEDVEMGGYSDYCMLSPADNQPVAGICHARGANAELPPIWLIYINVANLEQSLAQVTALGGKVRSHVKSSPQGSYCVVEDPSGAVAALFQPASGE